jgi:hypothetical protein
MKLAKIGVRNQFAKESWLIFATLLAVGSGIAQLVAVGLGRIVLGAIFILSLLYFVSRIIQFYIVQRRASLENQLNIYREILADIADRNASEFSEEVELTYFIGRTRKDDHVVERRLTHPTDAALYRIVQPTVNFDIDRIPRMDEAPIEVWSENSPITRIDLVALEQHPGRLRVLALFRPMIRNELIWVMRYTPFGGIWDPLRKTGRDKLSWRIELPRVDKLTVTFVVASGLGHLHIRERDGRGSIREEALTDQRGAKIVWVDTPPREPVVYRWDLGISRDLLVHFQSRWSRPRTISGFRCAAGGRLRSAW